MGGKVATIDRVSEPIKQDLTHQQIIARFWEITISGDNTKMDENGWIVIKRENIRDYAFPKIIDTYLRQKFLTLSFI